MMQIDLPQSLDEQVNKMSEVGFGIIDYHQLNCGAIAIQ
jgi:hypothetical protein